jgi:2-keto-3-deoxy-L-rhamnonate aldolase RhmA
MAIVQIESPAGLDNVEAIMATPGVDGVFPGLVDYSLLAYGEVITDFSDPRLRTPIERIMNAARAAGKPVGLPAIMPDAVPHLLELGVDWIQVGNDVSWITAAARTCVTHAHAAIEAHARKSS